MYIQHRIESSKLICLGLIVLAVRPVLQMIIDRRGAGNDLTDFFLGLLFGTGATLTMLGIWRNGRRGGPRRGRSVTERAAAGTGRAAGAIALALVAVTALASSGCSRAHQPVTVPVRGASVFVDDGGAGRLPIVFIHGNGIASQQWRSQLQHFRLNKRRAVAIDLPGFGKSAPPVDGNYSLERMTEVVDQTVKTLGLDRFVIVGHSYGGAVVASYAAAHPRKVAGVVYVDAASSSLPLNEQQQEQLANAIRADKMAVIRSWFAPMLAPSPAAVSEEVLAAVEGTSVEAFIGALFSLVNYDAKTVVRAYRGPRLAIAASGLETPLSFQNQFPEVEVVRISGAGHWLMLDRPAEVTTAIEAFVQKLPPAKE